MISFCAIVKDSLKNIQRLIGNIKEIVDEIVIVDTGSRPEVVNFEKKIASKVFALPWNNDFAYMRNFAIDRSSHPWILALDSDETITDELKEKIPKLILNKSIEGFRFPRIHYVDEPRPMPDHWKHLRLYRRKARYFGAVHESIKNLSSIRDVTCNQCFILHHNNRAKQRDKSIKYSEYLEQKIQEAKKNRDTRLLEYYQYKLWVQNSIYLLETDPNANYDELQNLYKKYELRKQKMEDKIKKEGWSV